MQKEAKARIKINKLLEQSGWRFFDNETGRANIVLENHIKITEKQIDEFGNDFEKLKKGFIDFHLLDDNGFLVVVLEAKSEDKSPHHKSSFAPNPSTLVGEIVGEDYIARIQNPLFDKTRAGVMSKQDQTI